MLGERCRLLHLRYLTSAWQMRACQLGDKRRAVQQAVGHHERRLMGRVLGCLRSYAAWALGAEGDLRRRLSRIQLRLSFQVSREDPGRLSSSPGDCRCVYSVLFFDSSWRHQQWSSCLICMQAWVKLTGMSRKLAHVQSKSRLLRALRGWRVVTDSRRVARRRVLALRTRWGSIKQHNQLVYWHAWAQYNSHLRDCEAHLASIHHSRTMRSALRQLSLSVRASRAHHILGRLRTRTLLSAWHKLAQRQGRARRVAAAAAATRLGHLLERAFHAWCLLGAWRHARLLAEDTARMRVCSLSPGQKGRASGTAVWQ